jgi:hypothetical protein
MLGVGWSAAVPVVTSSTITIRTDVRRIGTIVSGKRTIAFEILAGQAL